MRICAWPLAGTLAHESANQSTLAMSSNETFSSTEMKPFRWKLNATAREVNGATSYVVAIKHWHSRDSPVTHQPVNASMHTRPCLSSAARYHSR